MMLLLKGKLYSFDSPNDGVYKYEGVVLTKGKRNQWDDRVTYRPTVAVVEGQLWLYYSAYGSKPNTKNHIGLIKNVSWKHMLSCYVQ